MDTMGGRDGHELVDGAGYEGLCSGNGGRVLKKGPWTPAEDAILMDYVKKHGEGNWNAVQKYSGLSRCGKSCRLRWANHLRPNLKKGAFTAEEEQLIIELHARMGNKWARMAAHLPGRTDNEIKNYWNTRIKRHQRAGLPLYPSNLCRQILDGNQLSRISDSENGNRQHNEILHSGSLGVYETIFDSFMPSSHNFSVSKILDQFLGSHGSGDTPTPFKLFNEAKTWSPSSCGSLARGFPTFQQYAETKLAEDGQHFGPHFPVNSHPGRKSLPTFEGTNPSSHGLNGNLSTFQPLSGTVKLELPSFQCSEMGSSGSNMSSASPSEQDANLDILTTEAVPPNSVSMVNGSSLFEAVLYEEHKLRHANHEGYLNAPNSSFASNQLIGYAIPNSCATDWDACNALSTGASTFSDNSDIRSILMPGSQSNCTSGLDVKLQSAEPISNLAVVEKLETPQRDFSRPDALLDSNWFIWHPIGSSGEEPYDLKTQKPGAPVSLRDGHCLYACPLNDMPPVC